MEERRNDQLVTTNEGKEVYVTNTAIKATDVFLAIGAGAFALGGIGLMVNQWKKRKQLKEQDDFKARVIANMIAEGASEEEIKNARDLMEKVI